MRSFTGVQLMAMVLCLASCTGESRIIKIQQLSDYPSASAIEYFNSHYYIMGDDSRNLIILDSDLNITDSISLYASAEKRIPKPVKGDIEAISLTKDNKLLLLGSGSIFPYRSGGWVIDPATKHADSIRLDTIYERLRSSGLEVLNIEGVCSVPGSILMANRGNKAWQKNHLVFVSEEFWKDQHLSPISLIGLGGNNDSAVFNGVSGLAYAAKADQLLLTVSTENTYSNTGDGAIGKSYLWIVNKISSKKGSKTINPDAIIDLERTDSRFLGQKIESLCIAKETEKSFHLALTADNDDGSSTIFTIIIPRPRL